MPTKAFCGALNDVSAIRYLFVTFYGTYLELFVTFYGIIEFIFT